MRGKEKELCEEKKDAMKIEKEKFVALSEKDQNLQLLRVSHCPKTKTQFKI